MPRLEVAGEGVIHQTGRFYTLRGHGAQRDEFPEEREFGVVAGDVALEFASQGGRLTVDIDVDRSDFVWSPAGACEYEVVSIRARTDAVRYVEIAAIATNEADLVCRATGAAIWPLAFGGVCGTGDYRDPEEPLWPRLAFALRCEVHRDQWRCSPLDPWVAPAAVAFAFSGPLMLAPGNTSVTVGAAIWPYRPPRR